MPVGREPRLSDRFNFFLLDIHRSIWVPVFPLGSWGSKGWKWLPGDSKGGVGGGGSPSVDSSGPLAPLQPHRIQGREL